MRDVLVILGEGFEEIEAVTPIDILRRAGLHVVTASTGDGLSVTGSHAITLQADRRFDECLAEGSGLGLSAQEPPYSLIVLPGGPGVEALRRDTRLLALLQRQIAAGGKVAAICAAPVILADAGLLGDRQVTSYPGREAELRLCVREYLDDRWVFDGPICTSRGAGTSEEFSLALVDWLLGPPAAQRIRLAIVARA